MNKLNDQDIAVAEYLKSIGIPYNAFYTGFKNDEEWQADSFTVTFQDEKFDYHTGIGHRIKLKGYKLTTKDQTYCKQLKEIVFSDSRKSVVTKLNDQEVAVVPTSASVLYCLLMDAQAIETSFKYWADDFGYDTDSLKALSTYNVCCEIGEQIHKLFTSEQREKLSELLEDY